MVDFHLSSVVIKLSLSSESSQVLSLSGKLICAKILAFTQSPMLPSLAKTFLLSTHCFLTVRNKNYIIIRRMSLQVTTHPTRVTLRDKVFYCVVKPELLHILDHIWVGFSFLNSSFLHSAWTSVGWFYFFWFSCCSVNPFLFVFFWKIGASCLLFTASCCSGKGLGS